VLQRVCWREWKAHVQIVQLLEDIGRLHEFRVVGPRLIGPCPVHGGDNCHAFTAHRERNLWFCFTRCQIGGDVIDLAWRLCGHSWARAALWLERLAATPTVLRGTVHGQQADTRSHRAFRPYTRRLTLDPSHPFFRSLAITEETLRWFEAGAWHGHGFLEGTVAVRLHDLQGNPLGYAGRRLDPVAASQWGKWKWPSGYPKSQLLWNWHRVEPSRPDGVIVVEGPWSVMKLRQAGYSNAVALGGVHVSSTQMALLKGAPKITLLLDGDIAGDRATVRNLAARFHPHIRAVRPPEGQDPADLTETELLRLLKPR
jgi:DNA primase